MYEPILKRYYKISEVVDILNDLYQLKGKDKIEYFHITDAKKTGDIRYSNPKKITMIEIEKMKGFLFLHLILGIKKNKIAYTAEYLTKALDITTKTRKQLQQHLTIYNGDTN